MLNFNSIFGTANRILILLILSFFYFSFQLIWSTPNSVGTRISSNYEGSVDLREIKEIRAGKTSKEFERSSEECKPVDVSQCFVIFYGSEFKLRTLSVVGKPHSLFCSYFFFL